mmetsp:Transcript_105473/g.303304  ORF Transcript_105473/g.303304 Transcript_105473/m.303304 type:complete len:313 (-) Transcript_105473:159-1097(-)
MNGSRAFIFRSSAARRASAFAAATSSWMRAKAAAFAKRATAAASSAAASASVGASGGEAPAIIVSASSSSSSSSSSAADMPDQSDSASAVATCQLPSALKHTSLASSPAASNICRKWPSTKRSPGVANSMSHTGQHLHLFTKYASRSKHCKCLHMRPRAGVLMRSMETGQIKQTRAMSESPSPRSAAKRSIAAFLPATSSSTRTCLNKRFAARRSLIASWRFSLSPTAFSFSARRAMSFSRMAWRRSVRRSSPVCRFGGGAVALLPTSKRFRVSEITGDASGAGRSGNCTDFFNCWYAHSTLLASCFRSAFK